MDSIFVVGIILVAVSALLIILRTPMPAVFLSLVSGKLFAEELSSEAYQRVNNVFPIIDQNTVSIFLLLAPVVLSIILLQGRVTHTRLLVNSIAMIFVGASLIIFIEPYTNVISNLEVADLSIINQFEGYIVSITAGFAIVLTWLSLAKHGKKKKHR